MIRRSLPRPRTRTIPPFTSVLVAAAMAMALAAVDLAIGPSPIDNSASERVIASTSAIPDAKAERYTPVSPKYSDAAFEMMRITP